MFLRTRPNHSNYCIKKEEGGASGFGQMLLSKAILTNEESNISNQTKNRAAISAVTSPSYSTVHEARLS